MKLIYSIILSFVLVSGCNGQNIADYVIRPQSPNVEYTIEDGVIKLDKDQNEKTPNIANGVCIKAVFNEKTKQFDVIPCDERIHSQ